MSFLHRISCQRPEALTLGGVHKTSVGMIHALSDVREDQQDGGDHAEGTVGSGDGARGGAGEGRKGVAADVHDDFSALTIISISACSTK